MDVVAFNVEERLLLCELDVVRGEVDGRVKLDGDVLETGHGNDALHVKSGATGEDDRAAVLALGESGFNVGRVIARGRDGTGGAGINKGRSQPNGQTG